VSKLGSSMEQSRWQTLSPADFSLSAGLVRDHGALPLVREKRLFPRGNAPVLRPGEDGRWGSTQKLAQSACGRQLSRRFGHLGVDPRTLRPFPRSLLDRAEQPPTSSPGIAVLPKGQRRKQLLTSEPPMVSARLLAVPLKLPAHNERTLPHNGLAKRAQSHGDRSPDDQCFTLWVSVPLIAPGTWPVSKAPVAGSCAIVGLANPMKMSISYYSVRNLGINLFYPEGTNCAKALYRTASQSEHSRVTRGLSLVPKSQAPIYEGLVCLDHLPELRGAPDPRRIRVEPELRQRMCVGNRYMLAMLMRTCSLQCPQP
jgi:hypothetical protein